jgi:hypothetical protein
MAAEGSDKAIWATWYDLDESRRADFHAWLHEIYLPGLEKRPGYLWVAHYADQGGGTPKNEKGETILGYGEDVGGRASQYLILAAAESTDAFFSPNVLQLERDAPPEVARMLGLRRETRTGIFMEEKRVFGPAYPPGGYGLRPAPVVMFGSFRMPSVELEFDLGSWYLAERLALMQRTPGSIRTRKLVGVAGWAKYVAFYEFETLEDRARWKEVNTKMVRDPSHWTNRVVSQTRHTPNSPMIGLRSYPPPGVSSRTP